MKRILNILFVILLGQSFLPGQSCYIQLDDASGFDTSPYLSELEAAACALRDAFPVELQNDFAVYDFGFYVYRPMYDQSLENLFEEVVDQSLSHQYYLTFGRVINESSDIENIFVKVNLPNTDFFECTTVSQLEVLKNKIEIILSAKTVASMIKAINHLQFEAIKMESCCIPSLISSCSSCLSQSDIDILLQGKGFEQFSTTIYESSSNWQFSSRSISPVTGDDGWVIDIDGEEVNLYNEMISYSQLLSGMNLTFEGFITSDFHTCSSQFMVIDSLFNNSTAQNKLWWHVSEDSIGSSSLLFEYKSLDELNAHIGADFLDHISGLEPQNYEECKGTTRYQLPKANFTNGDYDAPYISAAEGHAAHWAIQTFYSAYYLPHNIELEYLIPKSSEHGNAGYADIVNLSTKEIFEIKTVKGRVKGVEEVKRYVREANNYCKPVPSSLFFHRGTSFPYYKKELPWLGNKKLTVWQDLQRTPEGGVLTYNLEPRNEPNKDPSPVFFPLPENTWDDLYELLKQMALNLNNATSIALNYIQNNPEQLLFLAAAAIVIIAASKSGTILSGGTFSPLTIPMIICGGVLLKVCYDFQPPSP